MRRREFIKTATSALHNGNVFDVGVSRYDSALLIGYAGVY